MKTHQINSWGRRCWSREERDEWVKQFDGSGLTATEFSRRHDINPKTFSRWVRESKKDNTPVVRFQQVEVSLSTKLPQRQIEIVVPNRMRVFIPVESVEELGAVLREVAQC